jgi:hypothetical protein
MIILIGLSGGVEAHKRPLSIPYSLLGRFVSDVGAWGTQMAKRTSKLRPWATEDVRTLKTLAGGKIKTSVIGHKLKRAHAARQNGIDTWCDAGGMSTEEKGVMGGQEAYRWLA